MTKRIVLLQALASTPADVTRLFQDSDEFVFRHRPSANEWSLMDILNHMGDVEKRYLIRLQRVVNEEHPLLLVILPQEENFDYQAAPDELVARFAAARANTLAYLRTLSPKEWQRPALHQTKGETNFRFLVQYLVDHDILHVNQMVEVKEAILRAEG